MDQKKMDVVKAAKFLSEVKEDIMRIADERNIEVAKDCVELDVSTVLIHEDAVDIGGNYGSVELRVYWENEENDYSGTNKRKKMIEEIMKWAEFDLDNDTDALDKYESEINALDDEILDDEYDATVGEWKRSLDDGNEGHW